MPTAQPSADAPHCPGCGYNLFGTDSPRCPECGIEVNRELLGKSKLPWTGRRQTGRVRAFCKTLILATFRPKLIAREMNAMASHADARRFRLICVIIAWGSLLGGAYIAVENTSFNFSDQYFQWYSNRARNLAQPWEYGLLWLAVAAGLWLFLMGVTSLPALYLPRELPQEQMSRATAISLYGAGPWTWIYLAFVALSFAVTAARDYFSDQIYYSHDNLPLGILCFLITAVVAISLLRVPAALVRHMSHCGNARGWLMMLLLPVCWAVLFIVTMIAIPAAVLFIAVMIFSFH